MSKPTGAIERENRASQDVMTPDELEFSQLGRLGLVSWQRHLAAIVTILGSWLVLGGVAGAAVLFTEAGLPEPSSLRGYFALNVGFVFLIAGLVVAVRFIHKRPLRSLVTPRPQVDWRRFGQSFTAICALAAATSFVDYLLNPQHYSVTFQPGQWLRLLPVILLLTTLQTSAEELLFRGYALQAFGLLTRRTWLLVAINGLLFMVPHLANPEMSAGGLLSAYYFCFGAVMALVTLRDNRLELALGAHAANNLFAALIANYQVTSLPTRAIWEISEIDPTFILISFLVSAALFVWLLTRRRTAPANATQLNNTSAIS